MRIAVFGLGEAGSEISRDLAAARAEVIGFDPADVDTPTGVMRVTDPASAVVDAEFVLAITAGADALDALTQALHTIPNGAVYADLSTSSPAKKRELATMAAGASLRFTDIALMTTVPDRGLRTPMLASGPAADEFLAAVTPLGATVEVVGTEPGEAATRKLLRSVVIKGVAAVLIESLRGARKADLAVETWQSVMGQLADADEQFIRRLVEGTGLHAKRRLDEMAAAVDLLDELVVASTMTQATMQILESVLAEGLPDLPDI